MSNPNSKNKLWLWISEDTSQNVNDICEQAHTTAFARNNFLTLKSDAHKENIEADFLLYRISERDLKLSHTNLLFTRRCPNETMVPHLNECIYYIKLLPLGMAAKEQGDTESVSQVEYFILTNAHTRVHTTNTSRGKKREFKALQRFWQLSMWWNKEAFEPQKQRWRTRINLG